MWRSSPPSTLSAYYMQRSSRQEKWRNNLYSVNHLGHRALYAKMIILWEYPWTWWITKESSSWLKIVGGQFSTALHTGAKRYCLTKNLILNFQAKNYWDHFRASQNFSTKLMMWTKNAIVCNRQNGIWALKKKSKNRHFSLGPVRFLWWWIVDKSLYYSKKKKSSSSSSMQRNVEKKI